MKKFNFVAAFLCVAWFSFVIPPAQAASVCAVASNLVNNCGFGTGTFSGWTLSGKDVPAQLNFQYGVEGTDPVDGVAPHSGTTQAYFADLVSRATTLSQTLPTVNGSAYVISFYLDQDTAPTSGGGAYGNLFNSSFGSASLISVTNVPKQPYTKYTFTGVATSASTILSFTFGNDLGQFLLDDVSVTTAAPEPADWYFVAPTVLILVFCRRRLLNRSVSRSRLNSD